MNSGKNLANFKERIQPTSADLFFSKKDPLDPRMGDLFKPFVISEDYPSLSLVLLGYQDDRGIKNNGGRPGAHLGPSGIRNLFYRLTSNSCEKNVFIDLGNWETSFLPSLEETQNGLKKEIEHLHDQKNFIISLGGGHDYGYPDAYGFISSCIKRNPNVKPLIINLDAHLDVRSDSSGINSGTPFYKILKEFSQKIDFYEVGIQEHCNSSYHAHFVKNHQGKVISIEDIHNHSLSYFLNLIFKSHGDQPLFVSLDMDVLSSSEAPGCSQSWPIGLQVRELLSGFAVLGLFKNWQHLGIYEVSPPLDLNSNTQRAAALFMNQYFKYFKEKHYESY